MRYMLPLQYFEAVAETGSIRAAAERLAITASALNRRILSIEQELGVELFERHSTGVKLNLAGELFIQHIRSQKADLERFRSRVADLKGMRLGHVRIGATRSVTRYFLPREIRRYREAFPGVTFEVESLRRAEAEDALANQKVDLVILLDPLRLAEFHSLVLVPQPLRCVLRRDHPLAGRKTVGLMECLEFDLLLSPRGEGIREKLESATAAKGLQLSPSIESNDSALLEGLAIEGGGIAFSIEVGIAPEDEGSSFVSIPLKDRDVPSPFLFVGQRRGRTLPVSAAKFVEELRKSLDQ